MKLLTKLFSKKTKADLKNDINILKLKEEKLAIKKSLKKGSFSKKTICFCIGFISIFALLCLLVQYKTNNDTHYLLEIISAVFGGELLMLLFKRIWTTEDEKTSSVTNLFKKKQNNNKNSSEDESQNTENVGGTE